MRWSRHGRRRGGSSSWRDLRVRRSRLRRRPWVMIDDPATARAAVAARLDRLPVTRLHRYLVAVVGGATFFALHDLFLGGTVATVLTQEFGVAKDSLDAKLILASAFLGAFVGA